MPLTPENAPESAAAARATQHLEPEDVPRSKMARVSFAGLALVVGVLLVLFPWSETWGSNYLQRLVPALRTIWNDAYFRGGMTGLGVVNIYFACLEIARLRRYP